MTVVVLKIKYLVAVEEMTTALQLVTISLIAMYMRYINRNKNNNCDTYINSNCGTAF